MKQEGRPNDLLDRLAADPAFAKVNVAAALDPAEFRRPGARASRRVLGRRRRADRRRRILAAPPPASCGFSAVTGAK